MGTPYVVLSGRARIERDGEIVAERGPGGFFDELAALDWGAGFAYARLATVTAVEPLEMLALAPAHLSRLMASAPEAMTTSADPPPSGSAASRAESRKDATTKRPSRR